jgi:hypothetical protein
MDKLHFTQIDKTIKYKNPFKRKIDNIENFERNKPKVFEFENAMIIQIGNNHFDYLVDGNLITQRCGASLELLKALIKNNVKAQDYELMFKISRGQI